MVCEHKDAATLPVGFRQENLFDCREFVPRNDNRELRFDVDAFVNFTDSWRELTYDDLGYNERRLVQAIMNMPFFWLYGSNNSIEAIRTLNEVLTGSHLFSSMNDMIVKRTSDSIVEMSINYSDGSVHLKLTRVSNGWMIRVISVVNGVLHDVIREDVNIF